VWLREEYPWGPAEALYRPGGAPDAILVAAYPAARFWGELLGVLRLFLTGLAFAVAAALAAAVFRGVRAGRIGFHKRLKHRLIASFILISVVPLFLLAFYSESGMVERVRSDLEERARLELDTVSELIRKGVEIDEQLSGQIQDPTPGLTVDKLRKIVDSQDLREKAAALGVEWDLYHAGEEGPDPRLRFSSRMEALDAGLIASRMPGETFRSLVLGGEGYGFDLAQRGDLLVARGCKRLLGRDLDTVAVLAVTRFVPGWMADAEIARGVSLTLTLYLLSLIAVGFVGLVLARRIAQPLERLTEATRAVAGGDLAVRVRIASGDEIGDLVEAFNTMTAQLQESREKLVRAEKESAWREMARQIAHEIKNPLTPMKLSAQHILRAHADRSEKFDTILREGLRRITEQIEALGRIAQDFSDFAKFPKRTLVSLDLNSLIAETVRLIAEEALGEGKGPAIAFREDFDPALPPVTADADEMRRVMINLLRNAIQAMADAGGEARVSTRLREMPAAPEASQKRGKTRFLGRKPPEPARFAEVRVADTGPGFPPEMMGQLFQPYFSTKSGGTGLGLAICKRAMDDLGGEIAIESESGKGAAVVLRIPLRERSEPCP
jgi:nitrogen fixation/metabolism regulation signal transduction histidine kinase